MSPLRQTHDHVGIPGRLSVGVTMNIDSQIDPADEQGTPSVFAFFPYLKTTKRVRFRGVWFRGSDDLTDLGDEDATHL